METRLSLDIRTGVGIMPLHPKLHSLRGLRFARRLAFLAALTCAAGLTAILTWPGGEETPWPFVVSTAVLCSSAGWWLALLLVPLGEIVLRSGMWHLIHFLRWVATPLLAALFATVWMVGVAAAADPAGPWSDRATGALLAVTGLLLVAACLATIYTYLVTSYRTGQVNTWRERLKRFEARYPDAELTRLREFLALETRASPAPFSTRGAFFPGITSRPVHRDLARPDWMDTVEASYEIIRDEVLALIDDGQGLETEGYFKLAKKWRMVRFYQDRRFDDTCARCPRTAAILDRIPSREMVVFVLYPGGRLPNHIDFAAPSLAYHMGLKCPPDNGLRVGEEQWIWQDGESIVFDNSYEHEVWNHSDEIRVVLVIDFLHPELSAVEREFFAQTANRVEPGPAPE